jgi:hypothetical protein
MPGEFVRFFFGYDRHKKSASVVMPIRYRWMRRFSKRRIPAANKDRHRNMFL